MGLVSWIWYCYSSVFGCLDPISTTNFFVTCLKGGKSSRLDDVTFRCLSCQYHRRDVTYLPSLIEVVTNIASVWPLILVYLIETGRRTGGDSLLLEYKLHFYSICIFFICSACCFVLEEVKRCRLLYRPDAEKQISAVSPDPRNL